MFGSLERLTAILVEHYTGNLPLWLAPEQVRVIPVGDKNANYAAQVYEEICQAGFRASIDYRKENLGARIHSAQSERVSYIIVIGDQEEESKSIMLRKNQQDDGQHGIALDKFLEQLRVEAKRKL
jgi:threonyl-tRNA synthetase